MRNRDMQFSALRRLAAAAGVLLLLGGCGPIFNSYRYISLEAYEDARVVQRARPSPGEYRWSVGEIPILYEIGRESYTLRIEIDPDIFTPVYPAAMIRAVPTGDRILGIEPDRQGKDPGCPHWVIRDHAPISAPVRWVLGPGCDPPGGPSDAHIRFKIVDDEGTVMGEEAIPYTVKQDGFYVYYDAV